VLPVIARTQETPRMDVKSEREGGRSCGRAAFLPRLAVLRATKGGTRGEKAQAGSSTRRNHFFQLVKFNMKGRVGEVGAEQQLGVGWIGDGAGAGPQ